MTYNKHIRWCASILKLLAALHSTQQSWWALFTNRSDVSPSIFRSLEAVSSSTEFAIQLQCDMGCNAYYHCFFISIIWAKKQASHHSLPCPHPHPHHTHTHTQEDPAWEKRPCNFIIMKKSKGRPLALKMWLHVQRRAIKRPRCQ